ncbi:MAG TPA: acyl-CoA dehydrogenase family protein [Acidimicrobiia bacterium]|nr:acyl-CoA dehydrogenase family protein [Acidimicrobiia bacterium]
MTAGPHPHSGAAEPAIEDHRRAVRQWIDGVEGDLRTTRASCRTLADDMAYNRHVSARVWETGFTRWGWPKGAGGFDGSPLLRAVAAEELTLRGLVHQNIFAMPEILGAGFAAMASAALVEEHLEAYLRGDDWWCQGFSEPEAGSDLANLRTRAVRHDDVFVVNGQKVWTTLAQFAQRCVLLARTGPPDSAHRGITAFLVDMDTPGITVRPLRGMNGDDEFSECFFDDVEVPSGRIIGELDGGWKVAMQILAFERATIFWTRAAWLLERLGRLLPRAAADPGAAALIGDAYQQVAALRARSRRTQHTMAAGRFVAAESSVDKVLMAAAEKAVFEAALELLDDGVLTDAGGTDAGGTDAEGTAAVWRNQYLYSRAASIYGGTGEIQRNIIAERLLGLPRG